MVRMNTASSQTRTVLLTLPPLSEDFLNQRPDVEHDYFFSLNLNCSSHDPGRA